MRILTRSGRSYVTYGVITFHDRLTSLSGAMETVVKFTEYHPRGVMPEVVLSVTDIVGIERL